MSSEAPHYISAHELNQDHPDANDKTEHHRFQRPHRTPGQLELGTTEIVEGRSDAQRQVVASSGLAESKFRHKWEHYRPNWIGALVAESLGVWFYTFAGQAATATYVLTTAENSPQGNLTMIGFAYALGITFAITVCASTSGGHFHPAMTLAQVIFKGFPARKAPFYIIAQIFGAFIASLMIYAMWKEEMKDLTSLLTMGGKRAQVFSPQGPAGIIAIFPYPPTRPLSQIFANEFFGDLLISMVIWSCLDAQNVFASPNVAPYTIGLAFGVVVWGFSSGTIVTNTARDVGARFACGAIWGKECFPSKYSALAALTNIPASLLGIAIYTFFLSDSRRPLASIALTHMMDEEKSKLERAAQNHDDILDARIAKTMSRGGDANKLIALRSRNKPQTANSDGSTSEK